MNTAKDKQFSINVSVSREEALTNSTGLYPNILYFPTDSDSFVFNGKEYAASGSRNNISGTLDVTKAATATAINNAYDNLSTGQMLFYLISDSSGNLPSLKGETSVTFHTDVAKLVNTTGAALGASVGDLFVVAKVKVLLVNVLICRILPLNDAKAANGSFPGSMGLESVWDKTQINKISGIETKANNAYSIANANDFPTRSGSNMNDCLTQGVYPWCTLGRPAGSTGAYTLVVRRSSTADGNGYYTVEQTAYGREGELGQVYKRLVFVKGSTAEYGEWVRIDVSEDNVYQIPGRFDNIPLNSNYSSISAEQLGDSKKLYDALNSGKIIKDETHVIVHMQKNVAVDYEYLLIYQAGTSFDLVTIEFNQDVKSYAVIKRENIGYVVDRLDSTSKEYALSANQGKVLNDKIAKTNTAMDTLAGMMIDTPKVYAIYGSINEWSKLPTSPAIQDALESLFDAPELFIVAAQDRKTIIVDLYGNPIDVNIESETTDGVTMYTIDLYKNVCNDYGESATAWLEIIAFKNRDNTWEWVDDLEDIIYVAPTYSSDRIISVKDTDWRLTLDSFTTGNISNNLVSALKGGSVTSIKANVDTGKTYMYNGIPLSIQVDSSYNWYIQFMYNGKIIMHTFNTTDNRGATRMLDIYSLGS